MDVCVEGVGSVPGTTPRTNPASRQRWWVKAEYDGGMCRRWYVQEAHQCSWAEDDISPPMVLASNYSKSPACFAHSNFAENSEVKKSSLFCPLWAKAQLVTAVLATSLGKQAYFATRARTSRGQSNWATRATHSVAQLEWPLYVRVTRWRNTPYILCRT